jgi:uncharacterized protein (TIGR02246 family)
MRPSVLLAFTAALTATTLAQTPPGDPPEKEAIISVVRAYEAAYAKGDGKALGGFFAPDASYTSETGQMFRGQEEIEAAIAAGLQANRGSKLAIDVETVRTLGPDSVLEKGATTVTAKDGSKTSGLYTAIHEKRDGKWKITELVESPVPVENAAEHLAELGWLVGKWEESDKAGDLSITSEYTWARGGNFLTRNIIVKNAGEVTLEGWQIVGWDPIEERIRFWTFDGEGGYSEGYFVRDGNRWLQRETGVTPDGSRTSADSTITKVSDDKYTWESINRTLDGDPLPGIGRIEIRRVTGN